MQHGDLIDKIEYRKGVTIVRLGGDINLSTIHSVEDEFAWKTKGRHVTNILFDLSNMGEGDTSGAAALVDLFKYMMKEGEKDRKIGLINLSGKVKDLLKLSKDKTLFSEYASEEEALKGMRQHM